MAAEKNTMGFPSMAASSSDCADTSLLCEETNDLCFDDLDSVPDNQNLGVTNDDRSAPLVDLPLLSEEVFKFMVESEKEHLPKEDYLERLRNGALDFGGLRKEAIDWIWKVCAHYGFEPLSVCLSVNYLDRFLSLSEIEVPRERSWTVQLLAVTCLSLAAKLEEPTVPASVDLQVIEPTFMFDGETIQRMELLLLETLDWKMRACTPFSFIDYFVGKINDNHQQPSESLISRSVPLILSTIKVTGFLEFKPSEIAAAVAVHVSGKNQPADIPTAVSCFTSLEVGRMLKCVEMIEDLPVLPTSNGGIDASVPQSPSGVLDADTGLNYEIDDLRDGSFDDPSYSTPETERGKQDNNPSQETDFKS